MKLVAGIRLRRTSHDQSSTDLPRNEIAVDCDSYDQGRTMLEEQVPEGWQITFIRTGA